MSRNVPSPSKRRAAALPLLCGAGKRLVAAFIFLAGRSGKRKGNESDETSSIPPNFPKRGRAKSCRVGPMHAGVAASWMDAGTELGQRDGAGTWGQIHVTSVWTRSPAHTVQGLRQRQKDWGRRHRICPRGSPQRAAIGTEHQHFLPSERNQPLDKWWQTGLFKGFQQEVAASAQLFQLCAGMRGCVGSVLPLHSRHRSLPAEFSEAFL